MATSGRKSLERKTERRPKTTTRVSDPTRIEDLGAKDRTVFKQGDASSEEAKRLRKLGGRWLANLRKRAGLTQRELAVKCGIAYYTFISQLEQGSGRVPPDLYDTWSRAVGVDGPAFTRKLLAFYDPHTYQALFGAPQAKDLDPDLI